MIVVNGAPAVHTVTTPAHNTVSTPAGAQHRVDRQTNSFIENSFEAGILLGGNCVLHAMAVARALVLVQSLPVTD